MLRQDFDAMGDRQKRFEALQTDQRVMPGLPCIVRMDGQGFSKFTRGMDKPFDLRFRKAMAETTRHLVQSRAALIGYTQSDEITLLFENSMEKPIEFDGRVLKLVSLFAAAATRAFNEVVRLEMPEYYNREPLFDARVYSLPTKELALEGVAWREADATRNSLHMAARSYYSHSDLDGVGFAGQHELLHAKGINWNDYLPMYKRGTFVLRKMVEKPLSAEVLAKIPEANRPTGPVMRRQAVIADLPPLTKISNLTEVFFEGAEPQLYTEAALEVA